MKMNVPSYAAEYKGFKYWEVKPDVHWLVFPSGFKTQIIGNETQVREAIDELEANFKQSTL